LQDFTAHEAVWLFVRDPEELDETEREELAAIRQASATAESTYQLVQDFMQMVRHREGERLDGWLKQVTDAARFLNFDGWSAVSIETKPLCWQA